MVTHHKLLLVASHAGAPLGVLVSSDEQLHQPGDGALLPQGAVVGWTKSQVADETDGGLEGGGEGSRENHSEDLPKPTFQLDGASPLP